MESIFRLTLLAAGIINFIPSLATFFPQQMLAAYGISLPDANFELLLRHRAVLFGLVGGLMIYAAVTKKHYELATFLGLVSMLSFVVLFYTINGPINEALAKVLKIDIVAVVGLLIGFCLYKFF